MDAQRKIRIAAVADVHCRPESAGHLQPLFSQMAASADVICLCGDLTDHGTAEEATVLASELVAVARTPVIAVLGNHDYESGEESEVRRILCAAGVTILLGEAHESHGVGFAGTKGFGGGFGELALEPWGESVLKQFVHEALNEALMLERALARLRNVPRIALLHYSPIHETVESEPAEILPFLGSSRLEEPLNRYRVSAVLHGHAHHGKPLGKTSTGISVYNVSLPLLRRSQDDASAFAVIEVEAAPDAETIHTEATLPGGAP